jgi:hypothetical protein
MALNTETATGIVLSRNACERSCCGAVLRIRDVLSRIWILIFFLFRIPDPEDFKVKKILIPDPDPGSGKINPGSRG